MFKSEKTISWFAIGASFLIMTAMLLMIYGSVPADAIYRPSVLIWALYNAFAAVMCLGASYYTTHHRGSGLS